MDFITSSPEYPIDEWINHVKECNTLPEADFSKLCDLMKRILVEESNVQPVSSPVNICGDIHGQFYDLLELFNTGGDPSETSYVFMGDYVDRGQWSMETITYLFLMKAKYPGRITLLRGNHETTSISASYGFYKEVQDKYGNVTPWKHCCQVFAYLAISAIIDDRILCLHGGLSPEIKTIDQVRTIPRNLQDVESGAFSDLLWSDPNDIEENTDWEVSNRGAGYLFGKRPTEQFNHINGLEWIARSHQLVEEGFKWLFNEQIVTVWSAPNYCGRCGNVAAVLNLDTNLTKEFRIFDESPEAKKVGGRRIPQYFL